MKKIKQVLSGKKSIYLVGDLHYPRGSVKKFQEVVERISEDYNSLMIGLGDWIEGIIPGDPRYHPVEAHNISKNNKENNLNMINNQWDDFEDMIKPISNQILGLHSGNHGGNISKRYSCNILESICKRLDIKYLGEETAVWDFNSKNNHVFFQTFHGSGGGVTPGYAVTKADKCSRIFADINVVAMGHTHKLSINTSIQPLDVKGDKIKQNVQFQCNCGSFLPNYLEDMPSYGERKMYPPLPMGCIRVDLDDCRIVDAPVIIPL